MVITPQAANAASAARVGFGVNTGTEVNPWALAALQCRAS